MARTRLINSLERAGDDRRPAAAQCAFSTELELISAIQSIFDSGASSKWTWLPEVQSTSGIADLIAIALSRNWKEAKALATIPSRWLYALKLLPVGQHVTINSYAAQCGVSTATAAEVLNSYARAGFCERIEDERLWVKRVEPQPIAERIVAIEAKLRNWRRALYQASQYASFASESWVVMDSHYIHSTSIHVDEFERRGIGLLALSFHGEIDVITSATNRTPRIPERFWQVNAEISKRLFI